MIEKKPFPIPVVPAGPESDPALDKCSAAESFALMVLGDSMAPEFVEGDIIIIEPEGLATDGKLADASFALHRGEILGVAGLQGMGQLDLFVACFGMAEITKGRILVDGKPVMIASPADAVRADIGISLVPEDRKTEALFLKLTGTANASIPVIDRFTRFGLIDAKREQLSYRAPQLIAAALGRVVPAAAGDLAIIDVGCGTGLCGPLLKPYASRLVGVDLSSKMLDAARLRG